MRFWQFRAAAGNPKIGELMLYGVISSESWWGDEVTPLTFKADLDALGDIDELHVFINSPGGDVFAGQAIHSMLKRHKATVIVHIDGLAASMASVVAMAGNVIRMPRNSMLMVHQPWTGAYGNAAEFRKLADDLDQIAGSIVAAYEDKTGLNRDKIIEIMDAETWLTADQAVALGFADEIEQSNQVAASISGSQLSINGQTFDVSKFRNRPTMEPAAALVAPAVMVTPVAEQGATPAHDVGARVVVRGTPHVDGQQAGEVREAVLTYVYGVKFDGTDSVYHWYVESELVSEVGSELLPTHAAARAGGADRAPVGDTEARLQKMVGELEALRTQVAALNTQQGNLRNRVALAERAAV